jgi:ABC-type transport system substrate-binding protein/DNA-binding SARP family transcriptional activator/DNA-binding beta-propeller fold protein YncE
MFAILGPLEVKRGATPVQIGGPRQRALLALLLCHANRVVSRDRLIDELLSDQPAGPAERMLRVQVSRLRKVLADGDAGAEPRLLARPPGYVLRVMDGELDLHAFDHRAASGQQALADGDPDRAAALLREAESLWRGRPLADLESEPFAGLEVQRLEALRLGVVEDRIEAELATGRHTALCSELGQLVAEHPLRERLRGQLMLALYRSGRQADALESYRAVRALLVHELAVEPGPQLRQLHLAILAQEPALDLLRPVARPGIAPPSEVPAGPAAPGEGSPETAAHPGRRRRTWRAGLALGAVAALAVLAVLVPLLRHAAAAMPVNANLLALISPADGTVRATVPLLGPPADVAAAPGSLWVAEADAHQVVRINPKRRAVTATIPVGTAPSRIIAGGGQVWVLDPADHTVSRIDPQADTVAQTIALGGKPSDLLLTAGSLWVADQGDGTVLRIDPATGRTQGITRTGGDPAGLAAADGAVWVATDRSGTLARIDARTGTLTSTTRVGDAPAVTGTGPAGLWVLDPLDATVSRVDPRDGTVTATVPLGGAPTAMVQSGSGVWLADRRNGTLLRLAPRHEMVTRFRLGGHLRALAATGGDLWAAVDAAGPGHRGGTLTSSTSYAKIDTIDPAAGNSNNLVPSQFLGLINDGLVTLDHTAGPDGSRLVPDLALALPPPSGRGRTYTFHLRPGIRYSTGALVRPSDVTRSFERLFQLGSSGASYYRAISGTAACLRAPRTCDLSAGIAADDRAGTVTFHLDQPDPDFLYKLTLAYADVLPAATPGRQAQTPLPGTGPYLISRYLSGRELVLVRNPRFREWNAAAQPAGYPGRIRIRLDLGPAQGAAAVAHGEVDFMPNLGQNLASTGYFSQHQDQLRINPVMITDFMFLNVRTPPFNDVRVRQAVNLALDRGLVVNHFGGPVAARPTCQIMPPALAGYRRYCPYTRDPAAGGAWHGPDLARARELVAASGTAGMWVTVWDTVTPPGTVNETRDAVTMLRQLGYRASLRRLPESTYFAYTLDSRNHAQVIDGGWSADYPSADTFIGKLACSYFAPGNGPATSDGSEFCDPAVDRQITRAAALQATDPQVAATRWAQLDRQLTDRAVFLPTVTPNEVDLLSHRAGNFQYNPVWGALIDQLWVR